MKMSTITETMGKFVSILKGMGNVALALAPNAASVLGGPAMGVLVQTIITAVFTSEQEGQTGPTKRQNAMQSLVIASPAIIALIERQTGRELVDEGKFQTALGKLIDAVVEMLNAFELLPPSANKAQIPLPMEQKQG